MSGREIPAELEGVAGALALETNQAWAGPFQDGDSHGVEFISGGIRLFTWGPRDGRIVFHASPADKELHQAACRVYWPDDSKPAVEIGVGAARGAVQMAKEIARRLLPNARAVLVAAKKQQEEELERANTRAATEAALVNAMPAGALRRDKYRSDGNETVLHLYGEQASGTVRIGCSYVRFDSLSVSHDQARVMLAALGAERGLRLEAERQAAEQKEAEVLAAELGLEWKGEA